MTFTLLLRDDLQEDGSRQILFGLGVDHRNRLTLQNQLPDVFDSDVLAFLDIVQAPVGILLELSHRVLTFSLTTSTLHREPRPPWPSANP